MKKDWSDIECYRWQDSPLAPSPAGATYGAFRIKRHKQIINIIASDGQETGWEHVSVSVHEGAHRTIIDAMPGWRLMCEIKSMFWEDDECVVQFHPTASEYVNNHNTCLHLFKMVGGEFPQPPSVLVGMKELGTLA